MSRTGTGFTTFTTATGPIKLSAGGGARVGSRAGRGRPGQ
jgi:hypothetical protein